MTFPCHDFICLLNCFFSGATAKCHFTVPCITQTGEIILHGVFRVVSISRLLTDNSGSGTAQMLICITELDQQMFSFSASIHVDFFSSSFTVVLFSFQKLSAVLQGELVAMLDQVGSYPLKKSPFFNEAQRTTFRTSLTSCPAPWDTMLT